jgi:hypothetical protein
MVKFLTYVYYRSLNYYKLDYQATRPLRLGLPMNITTFVLIFLRINAWNEVYLHPSGELAMAGIIIFGILALLTIFFVYIYLKVMKKSIDAKIEGFSRETPEERRRNGRKVLWYFILSPSLFVIALVF